MYDELAEYYHLIFENWDASIARQAAALGPLIEAATGKLQARILDAACGIGTQTIGLALRGHSLTGSDLSAPAITRAARETAARNLAIPLCVADLRDLSGVPGGLFDAILIADNAVAHLSSVDIPQSVLSAKRQLRPGGILLITVRDYDRLVRERPTFHGPAFYAEDGRRRLVHQVWDWTAEREYTGHLYITCETPGGWVSHHFASRFHAVSRAELSSSLAESGFSAIRWLEPAEIGFYQPLVMARS